MATGAAALGVPLPSSRRSTPFPPLSSRPCNIFPKPPHRRRPSLRPISSSLREGELQLSFTEPETVLLEALLGIQGRGRAASPQQLQDVDRAVQTLESLQGVPEPTSSSLIEGCWQLIFTTRPGTASPIQVLMNGDHGDKMTIALRIRQPMAALYYFIWNHALQKIDETRTFVGVDFFKIFQEVYLRTDDPRVSNIVKFSDAIGELKVEIYPIEETGIKWRWRGRSISPLISSSIGNSNNNNQWLLRDLKAAAAIKDGRRILFQFDRAAFSFKFLPFKVPYPVPFRLLGDEAKGWLDTTYLSHNGNVRVSRGNKGTTFVLQKETEPRQRLLSAISSGTGVMEVINELVSLNQKEAIDESETIEGEWQLLWASQMKNESWKSIAANGLKGLQIITADGQLENLVDTFPGFKISANGNLTMSNSNMYIVMMNDGALSVGSLKFPLDIKSEFHMELLYVDSKVRISRSDKGILLVHLRLDRSRRI